MAVIRVRDGTALYQHNAQQLFTPASNMKIFTTAVALDVLGANYRWRTSIYADSPPDSAGNINGDLVLYGRGAPDLISATTNENANSLESLAQILATRGIKRVRGNVVGDASYFRGETIGHGWQWNDLQWYYGAEASALTINSNSVEISITSARQSGNKPLVVVRDGDGDFEITNNLVTTDHNSRYRIGVYKSLSDNKITVWGEVPRGALGYGANLSVHDPASWAARLFVKALAAKGIVVDGTAISRNSRVAVTERFNPDNKTELAFVESKSLGELVKPINKYSINLYAELVLRTLGRVKAAPAVQGDQRREIGDDEAGANVIRNWLARSGIGETLAIHDGSGLSRLNLVTPLANARLLTSMQGKTAGSIFTDSLPVSGLDGTLQGRLTRAPGKIKAKTGLLTYAQSLSGYAQSPSGDWLAFSIMANDSVGKGRISSLIDQLALALLGAGEPLSLLKNTEKQ